jgi:hypothetical protein
MMAMGREQAGDGAMVKSVVFPAGVTAIGEKALHLFGVLESVVGAARCVVVGREALAYCQSLKVVSSPRTTAGPSETMPLANAASWRA